MTWMIGKSDLMRFSNHACRLINQVWVATGLESSCVCFTFSFFFITVCVCYRRSNGGCKRLPTLTLHTFFGLTVVGRGLDEVLPHSLSPLIFALSHPLYSHLSLTLSLFHSLCSSATKLEALLSDTNQHLSFSSLHTLTLCMSHSVCQPCAWVETEACNCVYVCVCTWG